MPPPRSYKWENLRRSIAMANPGSWALRREDAMVLLAVLQDTDREPRGLRDGLAALRRTTEEGD